jgi:transposase
MIQGFVFFVGIDWGTENHAVCVLDKEGQKVAECQARQSGTGLQQLLDWLRQQTTVAPDQVAFGIETPAGAVIDMFLEHNYQGFHINPKQLDRFRDRHTVAGVKDDRLDAYVIADSLRTDRHCFRPIQPDDPQIHRLRTLSRLEDDLGHDWSRLTNQLREQLQRYFPQMVQFSPAADDPWVWELLQTEPLPAMARKLRRSQVQKILTRYRIRRLTAEQVREQLQTPALPVAPGIAEAASEACLLLILRLRLLAQQRKHVAQSIQAILVDLAADSDGKQHRDVQVLSSLPGVGRIIAATMLVEAAQPLANRDYHALRAYGGVAPVTRQSGKRKLVSMRYACNQRLRNAFYHWARVSLQNDDRSRAHYHRLREKGHSHGRALRGVADRLLAMLVSMLRSGSSYDPQHRSPTHPHASLRPYSSAQRPGAK